MAFPELPGLTLSADIPAGAPLGRFYHELRRPTDQSGEVYRREYDGTGNVISVTDRAGVVTSYQYDANNRLTRSGGDKSSSGDCTS